MVMKIMRVMRIIRVMRLITRHHTKRYAEYTAKKCHIICRCIHPISEQNTWSRIYKEAVSLLGLILLLELLGFFGLSG